MSESKVQATIDGVRYNHTDLRPLALDLDDTRKDLQNARARIAALEEDLQKEKDSRFERMLSWRGLDLRQYCKKCSGSGEWVYGSTAVWWGGVGGQAMTRGVCDQCWGSGDDKNPWTNLRKRIKP